LSSEECTSSTSSEGYNSNSSSSRNSRRSCSTCSGCKSRRNARRRERREKREREKPVHSPEEKMRLIKLVEISSDVVRKGMNLLYDRVQAKQEDETTEALHYLYHTLHVLPKYNTYYDLAVYGLDTDERFLEFAYFVLRVAESDPEARKLFDHYEPSFSRIWAPVKEKYDRLAPFLVQLF
jgi:hypothetical protein